MEPIAALSIASNIIQIVDFASRFVSRSQELYQSADGKLADHIVLDSAAQNLSALCNNLHHYDPDSEEVSREPTAADTQMLMLRKESEAVVNKLRSALETASKGSKNKAWQSIYQALKSIYNDNEISNLASQLDNIRKQVDTTLLFSLRQQFDSLADKPPSSINATHIREFHRGKHQRDKELLNAVRMNNWQVSEAKDVEEFSQQLRSNTSKTLREQFHDSLLPRLYFQQMANRSESIPEAHKQTFQWIFKPQHSFRTWFQEKDSRLYWIAGKPGSGKSTLMKFIYNHKNLQGLLGDWARSRGGAANIVKAGFYFWNSGSTIQMSRIGLLRTLLYSCIGENTDFGLRAFPDRWKQFEAFGGGQEPWDWLELKRAFDNVISDQSRLFFFLIDGLDEFDGESKEIIELVLGAARPNVKICVASRPWLPFEDAFKGRPSLLLEDLTRADISTYVTESFHDNEHYLGLQLDKPAEADALIQNIVRKASGVFLWVRLVVESLLEGLLNSDRLHHLQMRLDALPSDLEALFDNLLHELGPVYFKEACQIFYLMRVHRERLTQRKRNYSTPSLLWMYFADDDDLLSGISAPWKTLKAADAFRKSEHMRRALVARSRGLLEASNPRSGRPAFDLKIVYLHRTARDYLESDAYWPTILEAAGRESFRPEQRWANANLWLYKVYPLITPDNESSKDDQPKFKTDSDSDDETWRYSQQKSKIDCALAIMWFPETRPQLRKAYLDAMLLADPYTDLKGALKQTMQFFTKVEGLYEYYHESYLNEIHADESPVYGDVLNHHARQCRVNQCSIRRDIIPSPQHEGQGLPRPAWYQRARRGIGRLRQRPAGL